MVHAKLRSESLLHELVHIEFLLLGGGYGGLCKALSLGSRLWDVLEAQVVGVLLGEVVHLVDGEGGTHGLLLLRPVLL